MGSTIEKGKWLPFVLMLLIFGVIYFVFKVSKYQIIEKMCKNEYDSHNKAVSLRNNLANNK
jgi:hypothetical protein